MAHPASTFSQLLIYVVGKVLFLRTESCRLLKSQLVFMARVFIFVYLVSAIVACGWGSHVLLTSYENDLQFADYYAITADLGRSAQEDVKRNIFASQLLAEMAGRLCPLKTDWPNCSSFSISFFQNYSETIMSMSAMKTIEIAPILMEDQIDSFENFAFNFFETEGYGKNSSIPLGHSDAGEGIFGKVDGVAALTTEIPPAGPEAIYVPVFYAARLVDNYKAVMFNLYSEEVRAMGIHDMRQCVSDNRDYKSCGGITDILKLVQDEEFRPAALTYYPIFPQEYEHRNASAVVATTVSVLNFDDILRNHLPEDIGRIDAVITSRSGVPSSTFTYTVDGSLVMLKGEGDLHDSKYESFRQCFDLFEPFSSLRYNLCLYPTRQFASRSVTNYPLYGTIISVCVVFLTSVVVFMYDYLVTRVTRDQSIVLETKRLFVRYVSHEIRTPLNTVHLGLQVLLDEAQMIVGVIKNSFPQNSDTFVKSVEAMDSWSTVVHEVKENCHIAVSVLDDLINYDKIAMGGLTIEISNVSIFSLVQSVVNPFKIQAKERKITYTLEHSRKAKTSAYGELYAGVNIEDLIILADRVKIGQSIRNLICNALKFTPVSGTVVVSVEWLQEERGAAVSKEWDIKVGVVDKIDYDKQLKPVGAVRVYVKDSGVGLTEDNLNNLFQEGMQFDANKLQGGNGSGLGLWVSKGFVHQHKGGSLIAKSEGDGCGCVFILELPVFLDCGLSLENKSKSISKECNTGNSARILPVDYDPTNANELQPRNINNFFRDVRSVLVVDDAMSNRKVMCRLLSIHGYVCEEAEDGQKALDAVYSTDNKNDPGYDLILMDFEMPVMNGPVATKLLRSRGFSGIIIGITGNVLESDISFFLQHGCDRVLSKPVSHQELFKVITELSGSI